MNKKLISIVIGAALAGGYLASAPVLADTQLYGLVDLSIDSFDGDDWGYGDDINMNSRTTYLGVKGNEDLGNGLKAIFKLEFAVYGGADESSGLSSGRDQWVGLAGDFGTVRLGSMATHYKESGQALNVMSDTAFDLRGVSSYDNDFWQFGLMSQLHDSTGEDGEGRADNTVRYDSPDFNGLSGSMHYTFDSTNENNGGDAEDPYGLGGQYKNGNIYAFASYITNSLGGEDDAWKMGGSYTMGNASVFGQYERGGLIHELNGTGESGANQWMLGGTFTMGNTMLMGGYGQFDDDDGWEYSLWQLAVKHSLSKRTFVYTGFNQSSDDCARGCGDEIDHFALGVQHKF